MKNRRPEVSAPGLFFWTTNPGSPIQKLPSIIRLLPADCKSEGGSILLLRQLRCKWRHILFYICRRCFKGQAYCCDECRIAGRRRDHREAERRYRQTLKGKKSHRLAENGRRHRSSKKNQKNMDDPSSTPMSGYCMGLLFLVRLFVFYARRWCDQAGCCRFCGCSGMIVAEFPRRGYGSG